MGGSSSDPKPEGGEAAVAGKKRRLKSESPPGRAKISKDNALSPGSTSMDQAPSSDRDPPDSPLNIETLQKMFDSMSIQNIQSPYTEILPKLKKILKEGPQTISKTNFERGALFVLNTRDDSLLYAYIRQITEYDKAAYAEVCLIKYDHQVYDAWIRNVNKSMKIVKVWRQNYRPVYWRPLGDGESNTAEPILMDDDEKLRVLKYWLERGFYHLPPAIELLLFSDPKFDTRGKTFYVEINSVTLITYESYDCYLQIHDDHGLRDMTFEEIRRLNSVE